MSHSAVIEIEVLTLQTTPSAAEYPNMAECLIQLMSGMHCACNDTHDTPKLPKNDRRLGSVLDSLATVLVYQESKEVISLGVRISPNNQIMLSIADNKPVGQNITAHFWDIWKRLTKLSEMFRMAQEDNRATRDHSETTVSPMALDLHLLGPDVKEVHDFKRCIYDHSFRKFLEQFKKGSTPYGRFHLLKALPDKFQRESCSRFTALGLEQPVKNIIECFEVVYDLIATSEKLPDYFEQFLLANELATREIQTIIKDKGAVLYLSSKDSISLNFMKKA